MKHLAVMLAVAFIALSLAAQEKKPKVAVMEMHDLSGKLDKAMLETATEVLRSELVATNRFVVISKERQRKETVKEAKKESWKECYDQSCRIELGQALSADSILSTTITLFGGTYTITAELVDLAKEATVAGAKAQFDGTEKELGRAITEITGRLVGKEARPAAEASPAVVAPSAGRSADLRAEELYNKGRDLEATDRERALELYRDAMELVPTGSRYHERAKERVIKLTAAPTVREGNYEVVGYNPNGSQYRGSLTIKRQGDLYYLTWYIGNNTFNGKGYLKGKTLTIDWGEQYPVIYTVQENGTLKGTWANGTASETLTPK
ncbi:MAG TPA: hypothetical protein PKH10_07175 [bacterium]|nr:hypothetical protein [bacterium]